MTDITELKLALNRRALDVAAYLLPSGVLHGNDWCAGSVAGEAGQSLKVCVKGSNVGLWADFAAGGESGDAIDLWCQVRGRTLVEALDDIRGWLGIEQPKFERKPRMYRRPERPKGTPPKSAVLEYLTGERKLSSAALRAYRVGEDGRVIVFQSLLPDGTLAGVKHLAIDRVDGKKKTWVERDCEPVLFGWQAIDPEAREITVVEGEVDSCTAWDYGFPALSVPFGGGGGRKQQWIEAEYDRMARFEVIYLALDMDREGNAAAEEIADRLGRHRCRRVDLPRKDLNECRKDNIPVEDIRACFAAAKSLDPPELLRAGGFEDAVVALFWPTGGRDAGYVLPFAKLGTKLIFRPGELSEWTGATGVGKSVLLSYALVAMAEQGARSCVASLEMAPAQLIRRMVKQAGNIDRPTEAYIRHVVQWLDDWLWMFGVVGKTSAERLLEVFEYARARYGCDVFAVDSLMRLGLSSDDYEGQEKAVYLLVNWALEKSVHIHLVAHARKGDRNNSGVPEAEDVKGTSEIGSNAFNIIGVWRDRKHEEVLRQTHEDAEKGDAVAQLKLEELNHKPPVMCNVAKQRNGDWEGRFGLWFSPVTYQYRSSQDDRLGHRFVPNKPGGYQSDTSESEGRG